MSAKKVLMYSNHEKHERHENCVFACGSYYPCIGFFVFFVPFVVHLIVSEEIYSMQSIPMYREIEAGEKEWEPH